MDKKLTASVFIVLLVFAFVIISALNSDDKSVDNGSNQNGSQNQDSVESSDDSVIKPEKVDTLETPENFNGHDESPEDEDIFATYTKFNNDSYSSIRDSGYTLLFFYAEWCPTCLSADAEISKELDKIDIDLTIVRVNYDDTNTDSYEKELSKKYSITYQHTYVLLDSAGNQVKKWNGGGVDEINEMISENNI